MSVCVLLSLFASVAWGISTGDNALLMEDKKDCKVGNGGCIQNSECITIAAAPYVKCGDCLNGFSGSQKTKCEDKDECKIPGSCDRLTKCFNTVGDYYCSPCPDGYKGTGKDGCKDVDECARDNGQCDKRSKCINTAGSRTCGPCPNGYKGTGETNCIDIDECDHANGGCDPNVECTNTEGSRECGSCPHGYFGSGYSVCEIETVDGVKKLTPVEEMTNKVAETEVRKVIMKKDKEWQESVAARLKKYDEEQRQKRLTKLQNQVKKLQKATAEEAEKKKVDDDYIKAALERANRLGAAKVKHLTKSEIEKGAEKEVLDIFKNHPENPGLKLSSISDHQAAVDSHLKEDLAGGFTSIDKKSPAQLG